jgi:hypothetical protein
VPQEQKPGPEGHRQVSDEEEPGSREDAGDRKDRDRDRDDGTQERRKTVFLRH